MKPLRYSYSRLFAIATVLFFVGSGYLGLSASPHEAQGLAVPQAPRTSADTGAKVRLEHADMLSYDASISPDVQKLIGNVRFRHGNATMTCDSAFRNEKDQTFEAFGNVHMIQDDTVHIYAKYLHYDGVLRLARLRREVKLENPTTTVFTDSLDYDRVADIAYYFDGGSVVDAQNTLTSDYGQFAPSTNDAEFRHNVRLVNDSTELDTEHLFYNTSTRIGHYQGPSEIRSDSGRIVSTRGVYDLNQNVGILLERSVVYSGDRTLTGDSIYYDGVTRFGEAFGQMELHDTLQRASLYGDYGYFEAKRNYAFATSRAYAVDYSQDDTLYVGADTLELISYPKDPLRDTLYVPPTMTDSSSTDSLERHLRAYHRVRIYRRDAQAVADSMTYSSVDSLLVLYRRPVMWSEQRQMTGDTTIMFFRHKKLDYVDVRGNAFGVEQMQDEPEYFNQLKGGHLRTYIQDSTVRQIDVTGGTVESIYYMRDEQAKAYSGMNRMQSSAMHISLDSGRLAKVLWLGEAKGKAYPLSMSTRDKANRLDGFEWLADQRPSSPRSVISIDSVGADYSLVGLKRFSGAQAALAVYAPIDKTIEDKRKQADSIRTEQVRVAEQYDYKYILRSSHTQTKVEELLSQLLSQWQYNPFSSLESPVPSSTNISIGTPAKTPLVERSNVSETSSSRAES